MELTKFASHRISFKNILFLDFRLLYLNTYPNILKYF